MNCPKCGVDVAQGSSFCANCGAAIGVPAGTTSASAETSRQAGAGRADDVPEQEVWQGSYSPKAMFGGWIVCILATVVGAIGGTIFPPSVLLIGIVVATMWIAHTLLLVYRRLSIHYRLTSYYFYQDRGVLWRDSDRMEFRNMNDTSVHQGPIERLLGVGTIRIDSADNTDPTLLVHGIENVRDVAAKIDQFRYAARRRLVTQSGAADHGAGLAAGPGS